MNKYIGKTVLYNNQEYEVDSYCFESKELCIENDEGVLWVKYDEVEIID